MYPKYLSILLVLGCTTVLAGPIQWNNVTPGNMDWSNKPSDHGSTTYNQIGSMVYGNDGSSAYAPEEAPAQDPSNVVRLPNGNRFLIVDGHMGIEYDVNGRAIKRCYRYADGRVLCQDP